MARFPSYGVRYGVRRPAVASFFHRPAYAHTGLLTHIVVGRLARGVHTFALIAVSHDGRRAYAPNAAVAIEIG